MLEESIKQEIEELLEQLKEFPDSLGFRHRLKSLKPKLEKEILEFKGCGKEFDYDYDMPMICSELCWGKIQLCPTCQEILQDKKDILKQVEENLK